MKYEITTKQASEILAAVAVAEEKVAKYWADNKSYEDASDAYAESGYSLRAGCDMRDAYAEREKSMKSAYRALAKAAELMDMTGDPEQVDFAEWLQRRYFIDRALYRVKGYAKAQLLYITWNL